MPQFGRPSADTLNPGGYTDEAAGSVNIFNSIDEAVPSDADFIQTPVGPTGGPVYVTKYTTLEDPQSSSGHILRNRYAKDASGGAQINALFELRQGYVSEGTQGTLIVSRAFTNISDVFAQDDYTLAGAEADAITDYTDLFLRVQFTQV